MLRVLLILLMSLLCFPAVSHAEYTTQDSQKIDAKVSAFFTGVNEGDVSGAYFNLLIPRMKDNPEAVSQLIESTEQAAQVARRPLRWQLVEEKVQGDLLVYRVYIVYSQDLPTRFRFVFFRTDEGWFAQSVFFKDINIDDFD